MSEPDMPPIEPGKGRLVYDKQRRTIVSTAGGVVGLRRGFSSPDFEQGMPSEFDQFVSAVIRDVGELPDRSSPDDEPDMMLVSAEELKTILCTRMPEALAGSRTPAQAADDSSHPRG